MVDIPLRVVGQFDPRDIVKGLTGIKREITGIRAVASSVFKGMLAAFSIREIARFGQAAVRAATESEAAITRMNSSLMATGNFTVQASENLQSYATGLMKTVGVQDEVTLAIFGTIEGITKLSTETLPGAMDAVVQIANLYNKDYNSAAMMLTKTLEGQTNAFARMGLEVDLSKDKLGRLKEILEKTSAGMDIAKAKMNTFQGATIRMNNSWDELLEAVGKYVTNSPGIQRAIGRVTDEVDEQTKAINESGDAADIFGYILDQVIGYAIWRVDFLAGAFVGIKEAIWDATDAIQNFLAERDKFNILPFGTTPGWGSIQSGRNSAADEAARAAGLSPRQWNERFGGTGGGGFVGGSGGGGGGGGAAPEPDPVIVKGFWQKFIEGFDPNQNPAADAIIVTMWNEAAAAVAAAVRAVIDSDMMLAMAMDAAAAGSTLVGQEPIKRAKSDAELAIENKQNYYAKFVARPWSKEVESQKTQMREMRAVFQEFLAGLADVLSKAIAAWGWSGKKPNLMGLGQDIAGLGTKSWGGNLASFLGLGKAFAGPLGGLISGGIGFIANQIWGQDKPITIEQPLDMRIVDINPRLANFFNFRGINGYQNRFMGVTEGGLW